MYLYLLLVLIRKSLFSFKVLNWPRV